MPYISSLKISRFRCYSELEMDSLCSGFNVFYGANGSGKTNILEAVSLFSPGKGLRGAKYRDMQNYGSGDPWALSISLETEYGPVRLGTGLDEGHEKRVVRIQGETMRGQNALGDYIACVWLTPQMDRLFIDSSSHRRKFLDRLVFAFDPGHSGRVVRYENAMRQRSRLLQDGYSGGHAADPSWLAGLEAQMAEAGVAIAAARGEYIRSLSEVCRGFEHPLFPKVFLKASGTVEELLSKAPALEVEDMFKYQLRESREIDQRTGGAASGPHKSDLSVFMAEKDMPAEHCSTGEQKALLVSVILAHAHLIASEKGYPPLLLVDEVAAHLDEKRRAALYDLLEGLGGQVWLTGTDLELFSALEGRAAFFRVDNAQVSKIS